MTIMSFHDNPGAFAFGILGNVISFLVFLAPLPTFHQIYKLKSTEGFQALPYLMALFSSMLWLYYAMVKGNALLLVTINSFGFVIEAFYIVIFITYATKDALKLTIKIFLAMNIGGYLLILSITHFAVHGVLRVHVLGWICVSITVIVFAAPLCIMAQVIRTKSVEFMPFYLSFFLTISAVMWLGYGCFLKDKYIVLPNFLGLTLGLIQMILYAIYNNRNIGIEKQKFVETKENEKELEDEPMKPVVVVNPLFGVQVFPIIPVDEKGGVVDDVKEEKKGAQEENETSVT